IAFLFAFTALMLLKGKNYYVSPVYAMMFAAGSVALEAATEIRWKTLRTVYAAATVVFSLLTMPLVVPILPVESFVRYQHALSYQAPQSEHQRNGVLPQYFADEFGWENMARVTAAAYYCLPPADRAKAVIFANNY